MISEDLPNPKLQVKNHQLRQQCEPGRSGVKKQQLILLPKNLPMFKQAGNMIQVVREPCRHKYMHPIRRVACSEAVSTERLISCCYKRVGEGPRGSSGVCPIPGGVAGWMISLTKGIFCNPFPAVPGRRLTRGHRGSRGELAGGCREISECQHLVCGEPGCRARDRESPHGPVSQAALFQGQLFQSLWPVQTK